MWCRVSVLTYILLIIFYMDTGSTDVPERTRSVEIYDANERSLMVAGFTLAASYNNSSSSYIHESKAHDAFNVVLERERAVGNEVRFTTSGGAVRLWVKQKPVVADVAAAVGEQVKKVGE